MPASNVDLSQTLLVIPCSGEKKGAADPGLPVVSVGDLLGPAARQLLLQGRRLAFERPGTSLDMSTPLPPVLSYYTGQPYKTDGVRDALAETIRHGLQCLIISAGYGVLRAEEPDTDTQVQRPDRADKVRLGSAAARNPDGLCPPTADQPQLRLA